MTSRLYNISSRDKWNRLQRRRVQENQRQRINGHVEQHLEKNNEFQTKLFLIYLFLDLSAIKPPVLTVWNYLKMNPHDVNSPFRSQATVVHGSVGKATS